MPLKTEINDHFFVLKKDFVNVFVGSDKNI